MARKSAGLLDGWTMRRAVLFCFSLLALVGCYACKSRSTSSAPPPAPPVQPSPQIRQPRPATNTAAPAPTIGVNPLIRVAVSKDARDVRFNSGAQGARILDHKGQVLKTIAASTPLQVSVDNAGFGLDGARISGETLQIESLAAGGVLKMNEQDLSSRVLLHRNRVGSMAIVAHLDLEEYLAGVLAGEVPYGSWHAEAMKAQAITSRSFAWYHINRSARLAYDVEATTLSQIFKAGQRENAVLAAAVDGTRGLVLTNDKQGFPALFHSTCGGQTAAATSVFPDFPNIRPLNGAGCQFCTQSHTYRWRCSINKQELAEKLRASYPGIARVDVLEFVDASGRMLGQPGSAPARAAVVRIKHPGGALQLASNNFRLLAGGNNLKSVLIEQAVDRGAVIEIVGGGFGHGVGLCQYGSQGMARSGYTYPQILGLYYPGAELTKLY